MLSAIFPALRWSREFPVKGRFAPERLLAKEHLDGGMIPERWRRDSLADLTRIGKAPGMRGPVLCEILKLAAAWKKSGRKRVRLLEIGCGRGDLGRWLALQLAHRLIHVDLILSDIRPEHFAPTPPEIAGHSRVTESRLKLDAFREEIPPHDICVAHLLLHHFSDRQIRALLPRLIGVSETGGVISDLERHAVPYHFIRAAFPWLMRSPVTVADGMISVQQAFSKEEWTGLAKRCRSGKVGVNVRSAFPFRLLMRWEKD